MLESLDEIDNIQAYYAVTAEEDRAIPFDQAVREIEKDAMPNRYSYFAR